MHLVTYLHPRLPTDSAEEPIFLIEALNRHAEEANGRRLLAKAGKTMSNNTLGILFLIVQAKKLEIMEK